MIDSLASIRSDDSASRNCDFPRTLHRGPGPTSEDGLDVAVLAREFHHGIQIDAHAMEPLEITIDEGPCLGVSDLELAREGMWPLPIDRREVDRLRPRAHLGGDAVDWHVEDQRRRLTMNVAARLEGLHERRVIREVREQPELDL